MTDRLEDFKAFDGFGEKLVQLVGGESEADGLPGDLPELVDQPLAMDGELSPFGAGGDEGALPVPHFKQAFAAEPLVDAEDRVLVDRQLASQLANRREPLAGPDAAGGAVA